MDFVRRSERSLKYHLLTSRSTLPRRVLEQRARMRLTTCGGVAVAYDAFHRADGFFDIGQRCGIEPWQAGVGR